MKNENRVRIDKFLKRWRDIAIENNYIEFGTSELDKLIYSDLIRIDVNNKEEDIDLKDNYIDSNNQITVFQEWINYYSNNPLINVFNDENWNYFCQFISPDRITDNYKEHIKIYIPLNSNHILHGAKIIFDFISKNNISHASKISRKIRFDNIVIRVINVEDATKIINFVKNNKFLQDGLINPNPFAPNINNIAIACDGRLSYNSTISSLINLYIRYKKVKKKLSEICIDDFYNFITLLYNKEFIYEKVNIFEKYIKHQNEPFDKNNYKNILQLIISAKSEWFDFDDYVEHYKKCCNKKERTITLTQNQVDKLLLFGIDTITSKKRNAYKDIDSYLKTNNQQHITRYNNLRETYEENNFAKNLIYYLNGENIENYSNQAIKRLSTNKTKNMIFIDKKGKFWNSKADFIQYKIELFITKLENKLSLSNIYIDDEGYWWNSYEEYLKCIEEDIKENNIH